MEILTLLLRSGNEHGFPIKVFLGLELLGLFGVGTVVSGGMVYDVMQNATLPTDLKSSHE